MVNPVRPTDPEAELEAGRIALWLDPDDIAFLADERRKIPEGASEPVRATWARIAFRAMAALHKAGVEYEPRFPSDDEAYSISR